MFDTLPKIEVPRTSDLLSRPVYFKRTITTDEGKVELSILPVGVGHKDVPNTAGLVGWVDYKTTGSTFFVHIKGDNYPALADMTGVDTRVFDDMERIFLFPQIVSRAVCENGMVFLPYVHRDFPPSMMLEGLKYVSQYGGQADTDQAASLLSDINEAVEDFAHAVDQFAWEAPANSVSQYVQQVGRVLSLFANVVYLEHEGSGFRPLHYKITEQASAAIAVLTGTTSVWGTDLKLPYSVALWITWAKYLHRKLEPRGWYISASLALGWLWFDLIRGLGFTAHP